jgi:NADH-quinone oxidoreductase subunit C/D
VRELCDDVSQLRGARPGPPRPGDPGEELRARFGDDGLRPQHTRDEIPTYWVTAERAPDVLRYLKEGVARPYRMLYDLTAVDERTRTNCPDAAQDFTVVYHLLSFERNGDVRIKVALAGTEPSLPSATRLWRNANWYEREVWDMFGVGFEGHPNLRRILMPRDVGGAPAAQGPPGPRHGDGPVRAAARGDGRRAGGARVQARGLGHAAAPSEDSDFMFLNVGPQHPGTHGVLRIVLQLDGEEIVDAVPDIGFHHRGAEKMGERQTWHTYIPYTDRIDYLGGVMNNLPYVLAVEKLAGIDRARPGEGHPGDAVRALPHRQPPGVVRHLRPGRRPAVAGVLHVHGPRAHLRDRRGDHRRPHAPVWFRIGGVASDLPRGWDRMVREFLDYMPAPARVRRWSWATGSSRRAPAASAPTPGAGARVGRHRPGAARLRLEWDFRKKRPYSGYEQFEFEVPTARVATATTAPRCASRRCARACASSSSASTTCPRARTSRPPADHAPAQGPDDARHRDAHPPLPQRELGAGDPGRRGVPGDRGHQGQQRLLPGQRRWRPRLPDAHPHALLPPHADAARDQPRLLVADLLAILGSIDFVLATWTAKGAQRC